MALGPAAGAAVPAAAPVVSRLSQPVSPRLLRVYVVIRSQILMKFIYLIFDVFILHHQARTWAASTFKRAYDDAKAATRQYQLFTAVENLINAYIRSLHYLYV